MRVWRGRVFGITTRERLLNAGLSSQTIQRWIMAGRLIPLHRGVYALGHLPPSPHAKTMAALLACGPTAVLSHRSAAKLWGLIRYDGPIEVTTVARTLQDLAHVLTGTALTRAVNQARLNGHLSLDDLPANLREGQTPRPTRSALEDAFLRFVRRYGLPTSEVNQIVHGYEVDVLWRSQRLIAELDGYDTHEPRFEQDREKDEDLLTRGYRVVRSPGNACTTRRPRRRPGSNSSSPRFRSRAARPARRAARHRRRCPRTTGT